MLRNLAREKCEKQRCEDKNDGQTAVEYLLLLGVVAAVVLIGMKTFLPQAHTSSNEFFDKIAVGIMDKPSRCGDNRCDFPWENRDKCCIDCAPCFAAN